MITRNNVLSLPSLSRLPSYVCTRCLHHQSRQRPVPAPTPFVPDHATFLKLIGRSLSRYTSKFASWQELFTASSNQLRERGIEPARDRRYLLRWREKYCNGEFGIGGDMRFVEAGVATLRVVDVPRLPSTESEQVNPQHQAGNASKTNHQPQPKTKTMPKPITNPTPSQFPATSRLILNLPSTATDPTVALQPGQSTHDLRKVAGVKLVHGHIIQGPYIQPSKGSNGSVATLKVQEGLWEHRRGHKVDGGERRKAEVRFKRGVEERRKARV
jgi:hypothetical protein